MQEMSLIDLFAGAGGMTLGFRNAGFRPVFAVEIDPHASTTYGSNFGTHVFSGAIEGVREFPEAEVIIGGPPCQGFSPLGRDRDDESRTLLNNLWRQYLRAVREVRPLVFVIENVPQFLGSAQYQNLVRTVAHAQDLKDYVLHPYVLNAVDFGVPQRRRRGIIIGSRIGHPVPPCPTHGGGLFLKPVKTVREAIGDLPLEPDGRNLHVARNPTSKSLERYRAVPEGGNRFDLAKNRPDLLPDCWRRKKTGTTDVFGRLWWDRPAFTIRTEFFKPEKGRYLHPQAHRPITHREAARLQTFPDDFVFFGGKIDIAKQIGNAVPPKLGEAVAQMVQSLILNASCRFLPSSSRSSA